MTDNERYIQAAIAKWGGDEDISIDQEKDVTFGKDGAYVHAWLYVCNDELEPEPGPSYGVFISEFDDQHNGWSGWQEDSRFTCDDDPDGREARAAAHKRARVLRANYPCAFVAVRDLSRASLPRPHSTADHAI